MIIPFGFTLSLLNTVTGATSYWRKSGLQFRETHVCVLGGAAVKAVSKQLEQGRMYLCVLCEDQTPRGRRNVVVE
jgi:hypothetical protein